MMGLSNFKMGLSHLKMGLSHLKMGQSHLKMGLSKLKMAQSHLKIITSALMVDTRYVDVAHIYDEYMIGEISVVSFIPSLLSACFSWIDGKMFSCLFVCFCTRSPTPFHFI